MKQLILLFALFTISTHLTASTDEDRYNRAGISIMHIAYKDSYEIKLSNSINNNKYNARYDINNIPTKSIDFNLSRENKVAEKVAGKTVYKNAPRNLSNEITSYLNDNNIGLQIISTIFNRQNNGVMDLNLLYKRGEYNATDKDYLLSLSTKRGVDALKETGEALINNSYIVIFDIHNYEETFSSDKKEFVCSSNLITYLYKVNWSEELLNQIWDCWIDENTPNSEYDARIEAFNKIKVPINLIASYNTTPSGSVDIQESNYKEKAYNKFMFNSVIAGSFNQIEYRNEDLSIKTTIYSTKPIRAKIGTKEGLSTDHGFKVYENVLLSDNKTIKRKRVGIIKATNKIADNSFVTKGNTESSQFYQIAGKKVEAGQTLLENKLASIAVELGYIMHGFDSRPGSNSVRVSIEYDMYGGTNGQIFMGISGDFNTIGMSVGANLGYGLRINNFQIYPLVGLYYDTLLLGDNITKEEKKSNQAYLFQGGLKANLNIYFPFQLYAHGGYGISFGEGATYLLHKGTRDLNGLFLNFGARYYF